MRQILTVKGQTLSDIAVQEYGNVEGVFQLIADNNLAGMNELPSGYVMPSEASYDISHPLKEGLRINIQDFIEIENTLIANNLTTVISNGKDVE